MPQACFDKHMLLCRDRGNSAKQEVHAYKAQQRAQSYGYTQIDAMPHASANADTWATGAPIKSKHIG